MKKLLFALIASSLATTTFAQNAKSAGITDGDVKNWAKNLKAIERDLDEASLSRDDVASASKQEQAKADAILQKHGIAAPNRVNKLVMINQCAVLVMAESGAIAGMDANTMAMLKQMGVDPFAEMRASTNQKDCKVVKANEKAIVAAMNGKDWAGDQAGNTTAAAAPADPQTAAAPATITPANKAPATSANATAPAQDYADYQVAQIRASDPSMTDEDAKAMAEMLRKQPHYAAQQAQWESQQRALAGEAQESAQSAEAEYKQAEEIAVKFRNAFDEFTKSKGDCGLIYKKMDKASAPKYVKKAPEKWQTIMLQVDTDILAFIDLKTRDKVELTFDWDEPKIKKAALGQTGYAMSDFEAIETHKIITITITNIEMYEASDKNSTAREYVISTKEGKVIHLWQKKSGDKRTEAVNFNGLKNASAWSWSETGGN